MISRSPAPFSAFVARYNTTVVDGMVAWFFTHTGGRGHVKLRALACSRALANPPPTQSPQTTRSGHGCESLALREEPDDI